MTSRDDRVLTALHAPRRNRYFFGKALGVADLEMEQDYVRGADAQLARLVLGAGVVCGLEVTVGQDADRPVVHVGTGLAVDGWGRRIVVPCDAEVAVPAEAPSTMEVRLCYEAREADPVPALSGEDEEAFEAGTWVEGYGLELRERTGSAAAGSDASEAALELLRAGRVSEALTSLADTACAAPPSDPGVTLATVTASADGELSVDARAARAVVPTNAVLLKLIAAVAGRLEECCPPSAMARTA